MTGSEDPLTPAEEEVRRLLAEARHTAPTPPDVVARLDRVLDDLGREPERAAPVVDLARRRRRVASLLVAAAAVVVAGVGLAQLLSPQSGSVDSTSAQESGDLVDEGNAPRKPSTSQGAGPGAQDAPSTVAPSAGPQATAGKSGLVRLRLDHLADDVTRARTLRGSGPAPEVNGVFRGGAADRALAAACGADQWGRGRFIAVTYGDSPAVLVLRRPVGDSQVADVFVCGSPEPVRSVTLPVP